MRDTSLDDFIGGDDASEESGPADPNAPGGAGGAEPASGDPEAAGTATDGADAGSDTNTDPEADAHTDAGEEAAAEPASPTFDWTPGGAACAACGEHVERRWADDGRLVCAACKGW